MVPVLDWVQPPGDRQRNKRGNIRVGRNREGDETYEKTDRKNNGDEERRGRSKEPKGLRGNKYPRVWTKERNTIRKKMKKEEVGTDSERRVEGYLVTNTAESGGGTHKQPR